MPKRGPFTLPKLWRKLDKLKEAMEEAEGWPITRVTQGRSSGPNPGAVVAAVISEADAPDSMVPQNVQSKGASKKNG